MQPVSQVCQTQRVAINARCRAHAEHHVLEYPFHGTLITHSSLRCLLLSCLSASVVPSCLSAGSLTLHTHLVINPHALGRLACASLWKPCAKHGHEGLQSRSGCARLRAETSRFALFPTAPFTKHRVLRRLGLFWLCRGSRGFIGLAFSCFQRFGFMVHAGSCRSKGQHHVILSSQLRDTC